MKRIAYLLVAALCASTTFAQSAPAPAPSATIDVKFFADIAMKLEKAEEKAHRDALDAANSYRQAAEMRARQQLAARPEYKVAADDLATAQRVQGEARSLKDAQLIVASDSHVSQAAAKVKQLEDSALAADIDVQAARAILSKLEPSKAALPPVTPETPIAGSPVPGGGTETITGGASASSTVKNAGANSTSSARKPPPTTIDIGMTRPELVAFLNRNSAHFKVISFTASRPAGWTSVQYSGNVQQNTTVHVAGQASAQVNGGPTQTVAGNGSAVSNENTTTIGTAQAHYTGSKYEYATIAILGSHTVVVGYHRNTLGGTSADTEVQSYQTGTVNVLLVDDVIAEVGSR